MREMIRALFERFRKNIPTPKRSRSTLHLNWHNLPDGCRCMYLSSDLYPELFELRFPDIFRKAGGGWRQKSSNTSQKYLWFPSKSVTEDDIKKVNCWGRKFGQFVVLGINKNIEDYFSTEMDFCLALSFNKDNPKEKERTFYGEAEYQIKYKEKNDPYLGYLFDGLQDAYDYLPIYRPKENIILTTIPSERTEKLPHKLLKSVAENKHLEYVIPYLNCDKKKFKGLPISEKIPEWDHVFSNDRNIELNKNLSGKTVIIIDDLYQSGATMWSFAKYLKSKKAKEVIGLVCVKSLRDTDNTDG